MLGGERSIIQKAKPQRWAPGHHTVRKQSPGARPQAITAGSSGLGRSLDSVCAFMAIVHCWGGADRLAGVWGRPEQTEAGFRTEEER